MHTDTYPWKCDRFLYICICSEYVCRTYIHTYIHTCMYVMLHVCTPYVLVGSIWNRVSPHLSFISNGKIEAETETETETETERGEGVGRKTENLLRSDLDLRSPRPLSKLPMEASHPPTSSILPTFSLFCWSSLVSCSAHLVSAPKLWWVRVRLASLCVWWLETES